MERYYPPGTARFVPANKLSPKFKRVHESFLLLKLFSANTKHIFCDFSVFEEPENVKTESVNENENKENKNVVVENKQVRRSFFSVLFTPYNKSFIDQASSVKMAGYWPRA